MITFSSRVRIESKLHPGVVYIVKVRTEKRRVQLRLKMAGIQRKLDEAQKEIAAIGRPPYADKTQQELTEAMQAAQAEWITVNGERFDKAMAEWNRLLYDEVHPAWVEWGLEKIDGLTVDEQTVTGANAHELIESDGGLWEEIVAAVEEGAGLSPKQAENLESPTTSSAAVDGQIPDGTAPSASGPADTAAATAPDTSPTR